MTNSTTNAQEDLKFRKIADRFIDTANRQCDENSPATVNSALLYGAARFCSFIVANKTGNRSSYEAQREEALAYYVAEFKQMLEENYDDYVAVFDDDDSVSH